MERNLAIWDDMDELGHQSGTERQTLPDLSYMWKLKEPNS